jgi:hypothetical protein
VIAGDGQCTTPFGEVFVWGGGEDEAARYENALGDRSDTDITLSGLRLGGGAGLLCSLNGAGSGS